MSHLYFLSIWLRFFIFVSIFFAAYGGGGLLRFARNDGMWYYYSMDNRPIGFFDSGLGGLTCIPHVVRELPGERIIYFGDTARTPYGSKAARTIRSFAVEITDFLVSEGVKMIVIACNTVSATCLDMLRERHPGVPILGIISPAARAVAKRCTASNHVGIIGTKVTIGSGAYVRKIRGLNPALDISEIACPAFVPLIEEGIIDNDIMDLTVRYYLDSFLKGNNIDTLVLGCTHYPLIRRNILAAYPGLDIIDPSEEILSFIRQTLDERGIFAADGGGGSCDFAQDDDTGAGNIFYASDLSDNFLAMIERIFEGSGVDARFKNFDLDDIDGGF
jgi:glutamate racemase